MKKYKNIEQLRKKVAVAATIASLGLIATNPDLVKADSSQVPTESNSTNEVESQETQQIATENDQSATQQADTEDISSMLRYSGAPVTVHHIFQETGREIDSPGLLRGDVGNRFIAIPRTDYTVINGTPITGTFTTSPQSVTFYYTIMGAAITFHYVDENGQTIRPDVVYHKPMGVRWTDVPMMQPGYTFVRWQRNLGYVNPSSIFPAGGVSLFPVDVTYIFRRNSVTPPVTPPVTPRISKVTVRYLDENGNQLASDEVLTGRVGDGYVSSAKEISGYTLKTRPTNATGFFSQTDQVVTYIYEISAVDNPNVPNDNPNSEHSVKNRKKPKASHVNVILPSSPKVNRSVAVKEDKLPRTGSSDKQTNLSLLTLGLAVSLTSLGGYFLARRRKSH